MSELNRIELESADETRTTTPSRVANIQDTIRRRRELTAAIATSAARVRQQLVSPAAQPLTTQPSMHPSRSTPAREAEAAPVDQRRPAARPSPIVTAATDLVSLVQAVQAQPPLAGLKSALEAKAPEAASIAARVIQDLQRGEVPRLEARGAEITAVLARASAIVREAHELAAAHELASTERALTASLRGVGYAAIRALDDRGGRVLKARSGATALVARIDAARGELTIDAAGFHGRACEVAVTALIDRLAEHGLRVRTREAAHHGRADGGELVRTTSTLFDPLQPAPQLPAKGAAPTGLSPARKAARLLAARRS